VKLGLLFAGIALAACVPDHPISAPIIPCPAAEPAPLCPRCSSPTGVVAEMIEEACTRIVEAGCEGWETEARCAAKLAKWGISWTALACYATAYDRDSVGLCIGPVYCAHLSMADGGMP